MFLSAMIDPAATRQTSSPVVPPHTEPVFRHLVDSITDYAIFMLTPEGKVASWNAGAEHIKGFSREEIIGKHFRIFYTEEDQQKKKPERELEEALAAGQYKEEGWRIRKDGTHFWASVLITPVRDEAGTLLGFGKVTRDLSERRVAELRHRLLIEGVTDYAIFSLNPEGRITSWNAGAERIKGYTAGEIIGQNFSRFYTEEDRRDGLPQKVLQTALDTGHFTGEGWRVRKDGSRFWASVVVTALRDEEGNLYGFSKVTRDITERKELLEKIQRHTEELELRIAERDQSNAELEAFAYSVSHDLRAPLRAIAGFSEALREEYSKNLDPAGNDYLREILEATTRMNALVQDLLEYGRVSRINLPLEVVSVWAVVQEAIKGQSDAGNVTMEVPREIKVSAHHQTLLQTLINLIDNGLKFHAQGVRPQVHVSSEEHGDRVRISVKDNGIGIDPAHQERIFQVFERLHEREKFAGTGIGLAIVKRAIARMNGTVGVESQPGQGSTFWMELGKAE